VSENITTNTWQEEYPDIYDYHRYAPFYRDLIRLAASKFDAPSTVLDAGGGTGNLAEKLRERGNSVVVADVSRQMIRNARSKLGTTDISYVQADLNAGLPVAEDGVDHVAALNVVYLLDDPQAFLAEVNDLLPDGGTLVVSGPKPDPSMWPLLRSVLGELVVQRTLSVRDFVGMVKSFKLQSQITDQLGDGDLHGLSKDDWTRFLTEAGFAVRDVDSIYEGQGYLVTAEA
jgi:ubiquinone/menaquinone biosynthesis C-methylase UbiE